MSRRGGDLSNAPAQWLGIRVVINARIRETAVVCGDILYYFGTIRAVIPLLLSHTYRCVNKIPVRHC
jgi:hypothetical protein